MEERLQVLARMHSDFKEKFGIPRQSGLADEVQGYLELEPEFAVPEAIRGMEQYSHLWLIWGFSANHPKKFNPTVRPPRLGGNTRMGVFATRSPFRPNGLGLSCVKLLSTSCDKGKVRIYVTGADLLDGTPIYDIKPYIPYADCHPEATEEFTKINANYELQVHFDEKLLERVPMEKRKGLIQVLSQDPRPTYQEDGERIYGMSFGGMEIRFQVKDGTLTVKECYHKEDSYE